MKKTNIRPGKKVTGLIRVNHENLSSAWRIVDGKVPTVKAEYRMKQ